MSFVSFGDLYSGLEAIRETLEEFQAHDIEYYNEVISMSQHLLGQLEK
jgi:hypothetical protein